MTGRELIIYILSNGLEDEPVYKDGKFLGFLTAEEVAVKLNVGTATVKALNEIEKLDAIHVESSVLFPATQLMEL